MASEAAEHEQARLSKIAMIDAFLTDLEAELGPTPAAEQAEAEAWVARVLADSA